jgi:hypothetical protein
MLDFIDEETDAILKSGEEGIASGLEVEGESSSSEDVRSINAVFVPPPPDFFTISCFTPWFPSCPCIMRNKG